MAPCKMVGLGLLVLMYTHQVEPLVLLDLGAKKLDFAVAEGAEEALVTDVGETIESELGASFLEENRGDGDVVVFRCAAEVVYKTCCREEIECAETAFLRVVSTCPSTDSRARTPLGSS